MNTAHQTAAILAAALASDYDVSTWTKKGIRLYLTDRARGKDMGFAEIVGGVGGKAVSLANVTKYAGSVSVVVDRVLDGVETEAPAAPTSAPRYVVRYCVECGSALHLDGTCRHCAGS